MPPDEPDLGVAPGTVKAAMWGVAFLDLMGYSEDLLATDLFPPPAEEAVADASPGFANCCGVTPGVRTISVPAAKRSSTRGGNRAK